MKRILLQTTIPFTKDDWNIERFSTVAQHLSGLTNQEGNHLFSVVARDRENLTNGDERMLSKLEDLDFDQLWLFGVDVGNGLSQNDCTSITRFRQRGGGVLTTRDHQDLGISFCTLGGIGEAHHFHTKNMEAEEERHKIDDTWSPSISWPNYHSGSNGDFQKVTVADAAHPLVRNATSGSKILEFLPSHPHEGAVSVPRGANASVVARGRSLLTGREFNLAVAFEREEKEGRGIADSSFHHFADYNFNPSAGCPSFVTEPAGHGMVENPGAVADAKAYIRNIAEWLAA